VRAGIAPWTDPAFARFAVVDPARVTIRPQGLYRTSLQGIHDEDRREVRIRLGLPGDAPVVLACGFGDYRKGFDRFAELARIADARGWPAHFIWVGSVDAYDERLDEARALVERLPRLRVTGFVDDPTHHYAAASVFVLTSREDPFPSVVLEAMASGLPVAAVEGQTGIGDLLREADCVPVPDDRLGHLIDRVFEKSSGLPVEQVARHRALLRHRFAFNRYCWDLLESSPSRVARVSVVVPSYNYARYLPERLSSILDQTYPVYEVLVYDDSSSDSSPEVAETLLAQRDVAWQVSRRQRNSGSPYSAWMPGAVAAQGDLIWIAEADDVADADLLRRLVGRVGRGGAVMAFAQSIAVDEHGQRDSAVYADYLSRFAPTWDWDGPLLVTGDHVTADVLTVFNPIPNVSGAVFDADALRAALLACGAQMLRLPTVGDWLVYAATLRHGSLAYVPDVLNAHRRHSGGVIGRTPGAQHASEVVEAQMYVASLVPPTDDAVARAAAFRDHVARSSGVST
jgi:hypothetical protein